MKTTIKNDGEPAFPRNYNSDGHNGMTLRDYFAAKAMQSGYASLLDDKKITSGFTVKEIAMYAYAMADAMVQARSA